MQVFATSWHTLIFLFLAESCFHHIQSYFRQTQLINPAFQKPQPFLCLILFILWTNVLFFSNNEKSHFNLFQKVLMSLYDISLFFTIRLNFLMYEKKMWDKRKIYVVWDTNKKIYHKYIFVRDDTIFCTLRM